MILNKKNSCGNKFQHVYCNLLPLTKQSFMKIFLFTFIIFVQLTISKASIAQDRAGIFHVNFNIDRELTHSKHLLPIQDVIQSADLNRARLSDSDIDSIRILIERTVSTELRAQTEYIYRKTPTGNDIKSVDFGTTIRGFPVCSKRKAIKLHEKEYYVNVSIMFSAMQRISFEAIILGVRQFKPAVRIRIIAFNEQGKPVYKKRVFVNDFEKLKGFEKNINGFVINNIQVLTSQQIKEMVAKSMQQLIEKGRQ